MCTVYNELFVFHLILYCLGHSILELTLLDWYYVQGHALIDEYLKRNLRTKLTYFLHSLFPKIAICLMFLYISYLLWIHIDQLHSLVLPKHMLLMHQPENGVQNRDQARWKVSGAILSPRFWKHRDLISTPVFEATEVSKNHSD